LVLLDHLLVPVGAELKTRIKLLRSVIGEHLPRSLKNLSGFTTVQLHVAERYPRMEFSGPNGKVTTISRTVRPDCAELALESLAQLDTSKTKRSTRGTSLPGILPTTNLRTLTLSKCRFTRMLIHTLRPAAGSSEVVICPELEEIIPVLQVYGRTFGITSVVEMTAARASRGEKLKTVKIIDGREEANLDVSQLRKHVWNMGYGPEV
jgi:hypothetical protein